MRFRVEEIETNKISGEIEVSDDGTSVRVVSGTDSLEKAVEQLPRGFIGPRSSLTQQGWAVTNQTVRPGNVCFEVCVQATLEVLGFRPVWKTDG